MKRFWVRIDSKADEDDIRWIAAKARQLYGDNDSIPYPIKLSWFNKNPRGFWIIKNARRDTVGSLEILPLKNTALDALIAGNLAEKEITPNDIYSLDECNKVTNLYIENFMAMTDGNLPNPFAFYQSMGMIHDVLNNFSVKIAQVNFYAMPVQRVFIHFGPNASGSEDLLVTLGFSKISKATKQGYPFYFAHGTDVCDKLTKLGILYRYRLEEADEDDIRWIALTASKLYGSTDCIPLTVKLSWFRKNPRCFWIVKNSEHEHVGSFEILPLKKRALDALIDGTIAEKEITPNDIYGLDECNNVTALYVENFMAIRDGNLPNPFACCESLLALPRVLENLLPSSVIASVKFYAMPVASFCAADGSSRASTSERLLRRWLGFSRVVAATKQGFPLYYANATDVHRRLAKLGDQYSKRSMFGAKRRRGLARVSESTSVYAVINGKGTSMSSPSASGAAAPGKSGASRSLLGIAPSSNPLHAAS